MTLVDAAANARGFVLALIPLPSDNRLTPEAEVAAASHYLLPLDVTYERGSLCPVWPRWRRRCSRTEVKGGDSEQVQPVSGALSATPLPLSQSFVG